MNTVEKLFGKDKVRVTHSANTWVTIPEVAQLLGKRIHQVRTMIWESQLGESRKEGRNVVVKRNAVLAYQKQHGTSRVVEPGDFAREVIASCELTGKLFAENTDKFDADFLSKVKAGLAMFVTDANSLVK